MAFQPSRGCHPEEVGEASSRPETLQGLAGSPLTLGGTMARSSALNITLSLSSSLECALSISLLQVSQKTSPCPQCQTCWKRSCDHSWRKRREGTLSFRRTHPDPCPPTTTTTPAPRGPSGPPGALGQGRGGAPPPTPPTHACSSSEKWVLNQLEEAPTLSRQS